MAKTTVETLVDEAVAPVATSMTEGGAYRHLVEFGVYVVEREMLAELAQAAYEAGWDAAHTAAEDAS